MHFSKTYSQLLLTLPPELRENAIQYRQVSVMVVNYCTTYGSVDRYLTAQETNSPTGPRAVFSWSQSDRSSTIARTTESCEFNRPDRGNTTAV